MSSRASMAEDGQPATRQGVDTPVPAPTCMDPPPPYFDSRPPLYPTVETPHSSRPNTGAGAHYSSPPPSEVESRSPRPGIGIESQCPVRPLLDASKLHPLMAAAYHNKTKSPLCRLPEAVLVRLMQRCDRVTVECLRRSSRVFLHIFTVAYPSECWQIRGEPWPRSKVSWAFPMSREWLPLFQRLIGRETLCEGCNTARAAPNWARRVAALVDTYLHCSGCRADHPVCLFSAAERCKSPPEWVCIGHQGFIRLCEHVTVPWSRIADEAARRSTEVLGFDCKQFVACENSDHVRFDTHAQREALDYLYCVPLRKYPSLETNFDIVGHTFTVNMRWGSHMPLVMRKDGRFEAEDFAKEVEVRYREARFICPQINSGGSLSQMLCDPVNCDCLAYTGKELFDWDRPSELSVATSQARHDCPNIGLVRPGFDHRQMIGGTCFSRANILVFDIDGFGSYSCFIGISGWRWGKSCACLGYSSSLTFRLDDDKRLKGMGASWYAALDPDSYRICDDKDGFGVYWCKSEGCMNYYRLNMYCRLGRLNAPFKPRTAFRHECS